MRQIFSSPRLENVEGVARMLNEQGIETWISQSRSYKGKRRRSFSYADRSNDPRPAVWVVRAEDQTRARALLRDAGLIEPNRPGAFVPSSYLPASQQSADAPLRTADRNTLRIKLFLLAAITVSGALILLRLLG